MEERLIKLSNGQIKVICEYFAKQLQEDGISPEYSYLCFNNYSKLAPIYRSVIERTYNEEQDEGFVKFRNADMELKAKYADTNDDGVIQTDKYGMPIIKKNLAQYQEEFKKLVEDNKEILDARQIKIKETYEMLSQTNDINLIVLPINKFPAKIIPIVVGTLGIDEK